MIKNESFLVAAAVAAACLFSSLRVVAQGSLTPPAGPPAPVMKTLDQVEARTPVNTLPGTSNALHVISKPGSYYFTGNISAGPGMDGIRIDTNNVTIDMNGFTLSGSGTNGSAITFLSISQVSFTNFVLRNGHIDRWGYYGIHGSRADGSLIENVRVSNLKGAGISAGFGSIVRDCSVRNVRHVGIDGSLMQLVSGCSVENVVAGYGQDARGISGASVVEKSSVRNVSGGVTTSGQPGGIIASIVRDSVVHNFTLNGVDTYGYGIMAQLVENCRASSISATQGFCAGISASVVRGCNVFSTTAEQAMGISSEVVIGSTVESTFTSAASFAVGISSRNVTDSHVYNVSGGTNFVAVGITVTQGGRAENCTIANTGGHGITLYENAAVVNCTVNQAGPASVGIIANDDGARIEGNNVMHCATGIKLGGAGSVALRNIARANTMNYNIAAGSVGPVVNAAGAATATNPFANVSL